MPVPVFKRYFAVGREHNVAVVPIVSSVKLAKISEKLGAAAIVVEGTEAGGHLGTQQSIKDILPDIVKAVNIPVIAAGELLTVRLYELLKLGPAVCRWAVVLPPAKNPTVLRR